MLRAYWRQRGILRQFVQRDVAARYRGSAVGLLWAFLNPLIMLAVYTFVFGYLFQADKSALTRASLTKTAFDIFAGLIAFNLFADCLNRAPGLIVGNANFVKKVVFPLEILSWMAVGSAFFNALMSLLVLELAGAVLGKPLHWTFLLAPLVLLPLALVVGGVTLFLSSLGVYLRDVGQVVGNLTMLLMFLSPVFYPASNLPAWLRPYFYLNPLTLPIQELRAVALYGQTPDWLPLAAYSALSLTAAWLGFAWFQKSRKGFADVL
jgi:lipopolysaccharide transport system permease protein